MSLADKSLLALLNFARNSGAMRVNKDGVYEVVPANTPRLDFDPVTRKPLGLFFESGSTNAIRNNTMVGATVGVPGALPANWLISFGAGITWQLVSVGVEDGIHYVDVRFSGTTSHNECLIYFEGANVVAATSGQTWTSSFYVKVVAGSLSNIVSGENYIIGYTTSKTISEAGSSSFAWPTSGSLAQNIVSHTRTLLSANTVFVHSRIDLNHATGSPIDITLRIGLPQLEQSIAPTSPIKSGGTSTARGGDSAFLKPELFPALINKKEGTFILKFAVESISGYLNRYSNGFLLNMKSADGKSFYVLIREYPKETRLVAEFSTFKKSDPAVRKWPGIIADFKTNYKSKKDDFVTVAVSYKDGEVGLAYAGKVSTFTFTDSVFPDFNALEIGGFGFNGRIQDIKHIPRALPEPMLLNASLGLI